MSYSSQSLVQREPGTFRRSSARSEVGDAVDITSQHPLVLQDKIYGVFTLVGVEVIRDLQPGTQLRRKRSRSIESTGIS